MTHYLAILTFCLPISALAIENGDKCTNETKLPEGVLCHEEEVIDCRNNGAMQGRVGLILCSTYVNGKSKDEMTALYKTLLADLKTRKPDSGKHNRARDFQEARSALIKSQKAWEASVKLECDIQYALFVGNAAVEDELACYAENTTQRINWLKGIKEQIDYNPDE
ncbi:MAG: lysozyme inhibitor LprI family protein [Methylophilaceae bacterium]